MEIARNQSTTLFMTSHNPPPPPPNQGLDPEATSCRAGLLNGMRTKIVAMTSLLYQFSMWWKHSFSLNCSPNVLVLPWKTGVAFGLGSTNAAWEETVCVLTGETLRAYRMFTLWSPEAPVKAQAEDQGPGSFEAQNVGHWTWTASGMEHLKLLYSWRQPPTGSWEAHFPLRVRARRFFWKHFPTLRSKQQNKQRSEIRNSVVVVGSVLWTS